MRGDKPEKSVAGDPRLGHEYDQPENQAAGCQQRASNALSLPGQTNSAQANDAQHEEKKTTFGDANAQLQALKDKMEADSKK